MSLHEYLENHIKNDEDASKKAFSEYLKEKMAEQFSEIVLQEASNVYDVYLKGKLIDTIFDDAKDARDVKKSLIDHDGYDDDIEVKKCTKKHAKTHMKEAVDYFPNKVGVQALDAKSDGKDRPGEETTNYFPNRVSVGKIKYSATDKGTGSKTQYFPNKVDVDKLSDGKMGDAGGGKSTTDYFMNPVDVPEYSFEDTVCNIIRHFSNYGEAATELYSKGATANDWNAFLSKVAVDNHLKYEDKDVQNLANKIFQNKGLPDTTPQSSLKDWNKSGVVGVSTIPNLFNGVRQ